MVTSRKQEVPPNGANFCESKWKWNDFFLFGLRMYFCSECIVSSLGRKLWPTASAGGILTFFKWGMESVSLQIFACGGIAESIGLSKLASVSGRGGDGLLCGTTGLVLSFGSETVIYQCNVLTSAGNSWEFLLSSLIDWLQPCTNTS